MCNRIADCGCGSKRKVNYSERNAEPARSFACNELTHAGNFECGFFDKVGNGGQIAVASLCKSRTNNAGTRNADIDNAVGLARSVECARHKRVILGSVAENYELCGTYAASVRSQLGTFFDNMTHHCNGVHIYAGFC